MAILVLFVLIICFAILILLSYKMYGSTPAIASFWIIIIAIFISIKICDVAEFDDGSIEVITTLTCSLILPIIYNLSLFPKWKRNKNNKKIQEKIQYYEKEIQLLEKKLDYRSSISNLIILIDTCGGDLREIESNKEFIEANKINEEIKNKRLEIKRLQYKLQDI